MTTQPPHACLPLLLAVPLLGGQSECEPTPAVPQAIEPSVRFVGEQPESATGSGLVAGDLNGDGVTDYVLGAPFTEVGGLAWVGMYHIFYGPVDPSTVLPSDADARLDGVLQNDVIGAGAQAIADVNGDGIGDLILGQRSSGEQGEGYVFFGPVLGTLRIDEADVRLLETRVSGLGLSATSPGDVNGDGHADLLITAEDAYNEDREYVGGGAFVFFGPLAAGAYQVPEDADIFFEGPRYGSGAGDVNGDGHDDLVLGEPLAPVLGTGAAYVFYGPMSAGIYDEEAAGGVLLGEHGGLYCGAFCLPAGDNAGRGVSSAGDVNQDGFDDVYVSAWWWPYGNGGGAVYLVHGPIEGVSELSRADARFYGDDGANGIFGAQAFSVEMNGDGWLDTVIVNYDYELDGRKVGSVFVWYGPVLGEHSRMNADLWLTGSEALGEIGELALLPDQDGDGLQELFLGNPDKEWESGYPGGAYIVPSLSWR